MARWAGIACARGLGGVGKGRARSRYGSRGKANDVSKLISVKL